MPCPDCKAPVPDEAGPRHAYLGASAGCWKIYGEVLAKEYSDREYWKVHRLTVDAYAAQHPGQRGRKSAQSVNGHLAALYLVLERELTGDEARTALGKLIGDKRLYGEEFRWLEPPADLGPMTILNVRAASGADEHCRLVKEWAAGVWKAWSLHHDAVRKLTRMALS